MGGRNVGWRGDTTDLNVNLSESNTARLELASCIDNYIEM
jgi:hypothetical protein